ncbi:MAG: hypothetical protein ABWY05_14535 [Noviherbaspirillum sp.]
MCKVFNDLPNCSGAICQSSVEQYSLNTHISANTETMQSTENFLTISLKMLDGKATQALRFLLEQVPAISLLDLNSEPSRPVSGVDIVAKVEVSGRRHALLCDVSASGQPRHVRIDLLQLRNAMISHPRNATPVLIAPFLSPEAQTLCREQEISFLDLARIFHERAEGRGRSVPA